MFSSTVVKVWLTEQTGIMQRKCWFLPPSSATHPPCPCPAHTLGLVLGHGPQKLAKQHCKQWQQQGRPQEGRSPHGGSYHLEERSSLLGSRAGTVPALATFARPGTASFYDPLQMASTKGDPAGRH